MRSLLEINKYFGRLRALLLKSRIECLSNMRTPSKLKTKFISKHSQAISAWSILFHCLNHIFNFCFSAKKRSLDLKLSILPLNSLQPLYACRIQWKSLSHMWKIFWQRHWCPLCSSQRKTWRHLKVTQLNSFEIYMILLRLYSSQRIRYKICCAISWDTVAARGKRTRRAARVWLQDRTICICS